MGQGTIMDDDSSIEDELAMDEDIPDDNSHIGDGKKKSQRTVGYMGKEDQ
jgi:hypothetical protein